MTHDAATVTRIEVRRDTGRIGVQPEGNVKPFPPLRPTSHKDAVERLDDEPYLAYVLVQMFKLGISLLSKRWAHLA